MPTNPRRKPQPGPKSFDVFRPGKMLSSPTSRPVILGHHPAVHDSTLKEVAAPAVLEGHSGRPLMDSQEKVAILPSAESRDSAASETSVDSPRKTPNKPVDDTEKATEQSAIGKAATSETVSQEPVKAEPEPVLTSEPTKHAGIVIDNNKPRDVPDDSETSEVPKVVVSQHTAGSDSVLKLILALVLVLILAVVAVDIVLDAGVWIPSMNIPHTHLIK